MKGKIKNTEETSQEEDTSSSEITDLKKQIEQLEQVLSIYKQQKDLSSEETYRYYQLQIEQQMVGWLSTIAANLEKVGRVIEASSTKHIDGEDDEDEQDDDDEEAPTVRKSKLDDEEDEE